MPERYATLFSSLAPSYRAYRPRYPDDLFAFLASLVERREQAWDCATGNGQVAIGLVNHFQNVVATDINAAQIAQAFHHPRIEYSVAKAEHVPLPAASVDLVTVGEALHWFEPDQFIAEAKRVLRPGGKLAVWNYERCRIAPALDLLLDELADGLLAPYWSPAALADNVFNYKIDFCEGSAPDFEIVEHWDLEMLLGYIGSWSASAAYLNERGHCPVDSLRARLSECWGQAEQVAPVRWKLNFRVGEFKAGMSD